MVLNLMDAESEWIILLLKDLIRQHPAFTWAGQRIHQNVVTVVVVAAVAVAVDDPEVVEDMTTTADDRDHAQDLDLLIIAIDIRCMFGW